MPTPPILKLPPELLIKIASEFCVHCQMPDLEFDKNGGGDYHHHIPEGYEGLKDSYSTLGALCRVSKAFRAISQPLLYHFVFIHSFNDTKALLNILQTVISNSHLASSIRWIQMNVHDLELLEMEREDGITTPGVPPELADQITAVARKYDLNLPPGWPDKPTNTAESEFYVKELRVLIETLILSARKLNALHLIVCDRLEYEFGRQLKDNDDGEEARPKKPAYPETLKRIHIDYWQNECPSLNQPLGLVPFESIVIENCHDEVRIPSPPEQALWSSVSHLNLKNSGMELRQVTKIIRACTRLVSFSLHSLGNYVDPEEQPVFISELLQALSEQHGSSLRDLSLNLFADTCCGNWGDSNTVTSIENASGLISNLKGFSALETLCFNHRHVFAAQRPRLIDVLPASIKKLRLLTNITAIEGDLCELAESVGEGEFSSLREVEPEVPYRYMVSGEINSMGGAVWKPVESPESLQILDRLCEKFARVGVKIVRDVPLRYTSGRDPTNLANTTYLFFR